MASPQVEDGYVRISTELFDALIKIRISGEARQLLDFIIRKTYGFQKKEDIISVSQFNEATGINKPCIIRGIHKLVEMNIVIKKDNGVIPTYCLQKDYIAWKPLSKKITVIKKDKKSYQKRYPQKIKDNIYVEFFDNIWNEYPKKDGKFKTYIQK